MDAALLADRTTIDQLRDAAKAIRHWPGASAAARAVDASASSDPGSR
jgi:hypothetical protein